MQLLGRHSSFIFMKDSQILQIFVSLCEFQKKTLENVKTL